MTEPLPVYRQPTPSSTPFTRVAVVGLGLIGGSVALAVRRRWPNTLIIGVDRKDVVERATLAHAIDVGADDLGMISEADLTVLAAPVRENVRLLAAEIEPLVARDSMITDVSSTKRGIMAAARRLPTRLRFIGGHPIAGAAAGGFEYASADLFQGKPWVLCGEAEEDLSRIREFVSAVGATPVVMTAEEHDRVMAYLSHLPQIAVSVLMNVVGENLGARWLSLAGSGLHDTTRLASSPADIWKDVTKANADEIRIALDELIQAIQNVRDDLHRGEVLERVFQSAQQWKSKLEES